MYMPPLEVIAWNDKHSIFMTCYVAGTETHPLDQNVFRYPGGIYVRKSTRLYWVDRDVEIEDITQEQEPYWRPPNE